MRQWDTKKHFRPRYAFVAKLVFAGLWIAVTQPNWRYAVSTFLEGCRELSLHVFGVALAVILLVTSPIAFPVLCLAEFLTARKRRLAYLKRNRACDEDI